MVLSTLINFQPKERCLINYHPDDFLSLIEEVESQGGAHLTSEACKGSTFRINQPIDQNNPRGPKASKRVRTTACERRAKFLVPLLDDDYLFDLNGWDALYDFDDTENPVATLSDGETPALAKVCAVDDAMGLWPRFQHVIHTGESFQE